MISMDTLRQRVRERYWDSPALHRIYSASALNWARWKRMTSDPYTALIHYCNAARRVRAAELRRRRLKDLAGFVGEHFQRNPPETLALNPFVQSFLQSEEAGRIRSRWRTYPTEMRQNLRGNLILLKAPQGRERGVLLIFYTGAFMQFLVNFRIDEVCSHYRIVYEPSWFTHPEPYWALCCSKENPVICQAFDHDAAQAIQESGLPFIGLPFGAQDWVDPDVFKPLAGTTKEFDAVMIANFAPYKRHEVMFRAMQRMRPHRIRLAIVGGEFKRTRAQFEALVRSFGVENDVVIFQDLRPDQVNEIFNRSKVSVFLPKVEGGNRSVVEGFAANVPVIVHKRIYGGVRRTDINPSTGVFSDDDELHDILLETINNIDRFRPRAWFEENTGYKTTTARLNAIIRQCSGGEPWTTDIVPKANRPEPVYLSSEDEDRFAPAWEEFKGFLSDL